MSDNTETKNDILKPTPQPTQPVENKYALLMETSGEEKESWYYFIRYNGNEEALKHLSNQLEKVEWYIHDNLSTFDLELDYLVSETTAKEMTKVDLNHTSFHRKFNGKLKMIDLGFKPDDRTKKKMSRAFDVLSYGQIEDYVSDEDVDEEDLNNDGSSSDESGSKSSASGGESSSSEEEEEVPKKKKTKVPPAVLNMPRFARAKQHRRKK